MKENAGDNRCPNPPMGYACKCDLPRDKQISLVAEFYVHRIRPSRIAYRLGIDIGLVEAWLSGEQDNDCFQRLIFMHRRKKYKMQVDKAERLRGQASYDLRLLAQRDFDNSQALEQTQLNEAQKNRLQRGHDEFQFNTSC